MSFTSATSNFFFPVYYNYWSIETKCDSYNNVQSCDINLDGDIDRDEFYDFIMIMTADTFTFVSQKLIVTFVVAPTVAVATKKATEGVPGVGKLVQKIPNSVYASLVTIAAVWFQKKAQSSSL